MVDIIIKAIAVGLVIMRLINTHTLELGEFLNEDDLEYAVLSNRWEDGEVTLQDVESGRAQICYAFLSDTDTELRSQHFDSCFRGSL